MGRFFIFLSALVVLVVSGGAEVRGEEPVPAAIETYGEAGQAYVVPHWEYRPVHEGLGWRLGLLGHGLFNSNQNWPFSYLNFGVRYKTDHFYVDLNAPVVLVLFDGLSMLIQSGAGVPQPFFLLQQANDIGQLRYAEAAILKVGQTFLFHPSDQEAGQKANKGRPMRLSFGFVGILEFVTFDAVVREVPDVEDGDIHDPIIAAPGAFVSIGGEAPVTRYDLALGAGIDLFNSGNYVDHQVWVIFLDLDVQFALRTDMAIYVRNRLSTYTTALDAQIFTNAFGAGVIWRLF